MGTVTKPYGDFVNNVDVADATKVNAQINALYNFLNAANISLANLDPASYSTDSLASTLAERDANGNVISKYPTAKNQNPNLLFNPSFRLGLNGWSVTNLGGSNWQAQFGLYGEGGFVSVGSVTNATPLIASKKIPMQAGQPLFLSCEMYAGGVTAGSQATDVQFFDVNDVSLGTFGRVNANNGTGFTKYTNTLTSPANTAYAKVRCFGDSGFTTTNSSWRKIKLELGSFGTTFSDDNTLNTTQYADVLGLAQVLSGGYKMQSGSGTANVTANTQYATTVTFPQAFAGGTTPIVLVSMARASVNYGTNTTIGSYNPASTQFSLAINSGTTQAIDYNWIAIGT